MESSQGPVSLGFLLVLGACAAQDSQRLFTRAQKQLIEAQARSPQDSRLAEAEGAFKRGEQALKSATYDQAYQSLRQSIRVSDEILDDAPDEPLMTSRSAKGSSHSNAPVESSPLSLPAPKTADSQQRSIARTLPRDALAKYLSGKRGAKQSAPAPAKQEERIPQINKSSEPDAQNEGILQPVGEGVVKAAADPLDKVKTMVADTPPASAPSTSEPSTETATTAPAPPSASAPGSAPLPVPVAPPVSPAPVPTPPAAEKKPAIQVVAPQSQVARREVSRSSAAEKPMTKIPGALRFGSQEVSLDAETMMNLNQTSKYLLENPSTTLVLRGSLGPGENAGLIDARYESLRAYLVGKGVPEDQVRLDSRRQSGARGEFEMYIFEH